MAGAAAQASSSGFWRFTGGEGGKCRRVSPLSACRTEDRLIDTLFLIDCSIFFVWNDRIFVRAFETSLFCAK